MQKMQHNNVKYEWNEKQDTNVGSLDNFYGFTPSEFLYIFSKCIFSLTHDLTLFAFVFLRF